MNEQEITQDNESLLTDLEPIDEVKGGGGGTGFLTLTGANTYTGTATVKAATRWEQVITGDLPNGTF